MESEKKVSGIDKMVKNSKKRMAKRDGEKKGYYGGRQKAGSKYGPNLPTDAVFTENSSSENRKIVPKKGVLSKETMEKYGIQEINDKNRNAKKRKASYGLGFGYKIPNKKEL